MIGLGVNLFLYHYLRRLINHPLMFRFFSIALITFFVCLYSTASGQVKWITWEEAQAKAQKEPRKVIVDVYTQWCGWCKKMDATTFDEQGIADYINKNFYAVKFDAEMKSDINLNGRIYKYIHTGSSGYHELAGEITFGKLSYPTIVFLDEKFNVLQPLPGYKDASSLMMIMKYFAENYYKTTPWKKYEEMFPKE